MGRRATAHKAGSPDLRGPIGATVSDSLHHKLQAAMPFPAKAILIGAFADAFNTIRPNQALGGQTPAEWLANQAAEETPASQTP